MVVTEDLEQYKIFWTKFLKEYGRDIKTVAIHSAAEERVIFDEIFKEKNIYNLNKKNWNLNEEITVTFDLIIFNNIIMYSKNPERWLKNIFNSCKFVIIQDLIDRKRNDDDEGMRSQLSLADSGDSMRYSFSHLNQISQSYVKYDISNLKNRVA